MLETVTLLFLFPTSLDVKEAPEECDIFIVGDGGGWLLFYNYASIKKDNRNGLYIIKVILILGHL